MSEIITRKIRIADKATGKSYLCELTIDPAALAVALSYVTRKSGMTVSSQREKGAIKATYTLEAKEVAS